jgi:hypothetical protein
VRGAIVGEQKASRRVLVRDPVSSAAAIGLAGAATRQRSALTADWQLHAKPMPVPLEFFYD